MTAAVWRTSRFAVDLTKPVVMGIVNLTPDSFFDGGQLTSKQHAIDHCKRLLDEGADILDLGAESTRPGAESVALDDELRRLMPVLEAAVQLNCPVSVDTMKPDVMQAALAAGADIINDVRALREPGAAELVAAHASCGVCLMHMQSEPRSMQHAPRYQNVVNEVALFLRQRAASLQALGVDASRIVLDPGIGFGKTVDDNFELLRHQRDLLVNQGHALLVGWSRKSALGAVTGRVKKDRLPASLAAALASLCQGAAIVRVHDVAATVDAISVWRAAGLLHA